MTHNPSTPISRRRVLAGAGMGVGAVALGAPALSQLDDALEPPRDALVFLFLRGGMDGLSLCVPYQEADYYRLRPGLAVPPPGRPNGAVDLDGFFGLAPAAAALLPAYQKGDLAILPAAGSPDPNRSHFYAMERIEAGLPNASGNIPPSGWLGRWLDLYQRRRPVPLRGLALSPNLPRTLAGSPGVLAIYDPENFTFPGYGNTAAQRVAALKGLYGGAPRPLADAALGTLDSIDLISGIDFANYKPAHGAVYPATLLGNRLRNTAAMIKAGVGVEAYEVDFGGWDHHENQGTTAGTFAKMCEELCLSLAAFYLDLRDQMNRVTLVAMSEFGRRVDENGSAGTDHGRGGVMLALGGNVLGGRVIHRWPGLAPTQLDDFAVQVTIDYRDVLAEILSERLRAHSLDRIFPGFQPNEIGVVRS